MYRHLILCKKKNHEINYKIFKNKKNIYEQYKLINDSDK